MDEESKEKQEDPLFFDWVKHPTRFVKKSNMIIKKVSKIWNGCLYKGNKNDKLELQLRYYDNCLRYVYIS